MSFGGNHISIYLGNGKAIDAPVPGKTVQIRDAWEQQSNLTSIRRIVPAGAAKGRLRSDVRQHVVALALVPTRLSRRAHAVHR